MSRSAVRGRVVLYFPRFVAPSHPGSKAVDYPPLSYLALGGPLRDAGFEVRIIDARLETDAAERIRRETKDAICLGITLELYDASAPEWQMPDFIRADTEIKPGLLEGLVSYEAYNRMASPAVDAGDVYTEVASLSIPTWKQVSDFLAEMRELRRVFESVA